MRITFSKTPPKRALQRRGGVCDVYGGQDKAPAGASEGREARYVLIAGRSGGVWGRAPVTKLHIPLEGNVAQRQGVRRYLITKELTTVSSFVMRCQAESNCCTWFCRPVPNHSAMAPWLGNAKIKLISQFQNSVTLCVDVGVPGVLLDEFAAERNVVAHQHREDAVGLGCILYVDGLHHTLGRVHSRVPELFC